MWKLLILVSLALTIQGCISGKSTYLNEVYGKNGNLLSRIQVKLKNGIIPVKGSAASEIGVVQYGKNEWLLEAGHTSMQDNETLFKSLESTAKTAITGGIRE